MKAKRKILAASVAALLFTQLTAAADVSVDIDGKKVDFDKYSGAEPYIDNDRVMIPIRAVAEGMGADIWWNDKTYEVSVNDDIVLQIGHSTAYINDQPVELDAPAVIRSGRTYIPLRFVAENMGAKVDWDNDERCVKISTKQTSAPAAPSTGTDTTVSPAAASVTPASDDYFGGEKWKAYAEKYKSDPSVTHLIFVKYKSGSDADVIMYERAETEHGWAPRIMCSAYVGRDGIGEGAVNVAQTPIGDFGIKTAFGIKENPGTSLPYINVTEDTYCCSDKEYFNTIINAKDLKHQCSGEHMCEYVPEYNYGFFFDYNKDGEFKKGSAFFFHCKGKKPYTAGCIAVDEDDMVRILKHMTAGTRLCIDKE